MKHVPKRLIFAVCLFNLCWNLFAGDWPFDSRKMADAFASSDNGRFRKGLLFEGNGERVSSWAAGEVIWVSDAPTFASVVPNRGTVAVEHEDGFRSLYQGIDVIPSLRDPSAPKKLSLGDTLGYAGEDGWVFEVSDVVLSRIVDPLVLLPLRDKLKPPLASEVELVRPGDRRVIKDLMEIPSGRWTISMTLGVNPAEYAIPTEISAYWVGERVARLRFDALVEKNGRIVLETPEHKNYNDIYDSSGHLIVGDVTVSTGRGTLELRFKDETGRVSSRSWRLSVPDN